jgi:endonuclease G
LPTSKQPVTVICKERFAVGFNTVTKQPAWVAYHVTPQQLAAVGTPRAFSFKPDPAVPASAQATDAEYAGTDFDKGHLVPYEDVNDSAIAAVESFKYINASPQYYWYNRGIWKTLEGKVREAGAVTELYVVAGPIVTDKPLAMMGSVPVANAFWKIIVNPATKTITTYIIPHQKGFKSDDLPSMLKSEGDVFKITGVNPVPSKKRLTVMLK